MLAFVNMSYLNQAESDLSSNWKKDLLKQFFGNLFIWKVLNADWGHQKGGHREKSIKSY